MIKRYKKISLVVAMFLIAVNSKAQQTIFTPANVSSITSSPSFDFGTTTGLVDGDLSTYNGVFTPSVPLLITFKMVKPTAILGYNIYFFLEEFYGCDSVSISGSNDGHNYISLNSQSTSSAVPSEVLSANFSNKKSYTYYQFAFSGYTNNVALLLLNEIQAFTSLTPGPPALTVAPGNAGNTANLSWDDQHLGIVNGLDVYELQRSADGVNFTPIATINSPGTTYADTTLTQLSTYYYRLRARKDTLFSPYSSIVKVTTVSDELKHGPVLATAPRTGYAVPLSWSLTIYTPGSFELYKSINGTDYTLLKTLDKALTAYTDTITDTTATYWYKVRGVNYTSSSPYSNVVKVTDVLTAPTITAAAGLVGTKASLTWSPIVYPSGSFELYRSTDDISFTLVQKLNGNVTGSTDSTLKNATNYWYKIRGENYKGFSPYSNVAKIKTVSDTLTNIPVFTAIASTGTEAQLAWNFTFNTPVLGGFELEQSTDGVHFTLFGKFNGNVNTYNEESLTPNTAYWFRIRAYNYISKSPYSAVIKVRTNSITSLPIDITNDGGSLFVSANSLASDPTEGPANLIDNNLSTKMSVLQYDDLNDTLAVIYKPKGSYIVTSYAIATANDSPSHDPGAWTFAGSNDSTTWVTLDTRVNQLGGNTPRGTLFNYVIANPGKTAYKYYRLYFTINNISFDGVAYQVAEWEIFGLSGNAPDLPTALQVTSSTPTSLSLSWKAGANAGTGFKLQRSNDGVNYTTAADSLATGTLTYTNNGLLDSTIYYYRMQSTGKGGTVSGWSNVAQGTTSFTAGLPLTPGNLAVTSFTETVVNLQWVDRSYNETGFKLERSSDSVTFTQVITLPTNTMIASDSTVWPGNTYYYRIKSYNDKGASATYSNVAKVITSGANSPPMATQPFIYRKICSGTGSFTYSFSDISPGPQSESSQTLRVTSVTSDSSKYFSGFKFVPVVNNGVVTYSFTTSGVAMPGDSCNVLVTVKDNGGTLNSGIDSTVFVVKIYFVSFTVTITADKPTGNVPRYALINLTASSSAPDNTTYSWTGADGIEGLTNLLVLPVRPIQTTTYTVTATTPQGCQATAQITVSPIDSMVVANVLTPNGDNKNDTWIIWGIEKKPNNLVKVIDKAGRIVFEKRGYNNDWEGTYGGGPLSQGAYFYMVDPGDGGKIQKGMLTIIR